MKRIYILLSAVCLTLCTSAFGDCPADATSLAKKMTEKMILQRSSILSTVGTVTYESGPNKDVVTRYSYRDSATRYQTGSVKLKGAKRAINEDIKATAKDRASRELTLENYRFECESIYNLNSKEIYVYKIFPKVEASLMYKHGSEIHIDRTTAFPIKASGPVFLLQVDATLDTYFQVIKGTNFTRKTFLHVPSRPFLLGGGVYALTTTFEYSPENIVLEQQPQAAAFAEMPERVP